MATPLYSSKLSGSKFKNWIKAGLGVLYTKEGIEPFVYDEIEQFQQKCFSDICNNNGLPAGTTCSGCCTENVIVCPTNRICNARRGKCSFHRNSATQYLPSGCPKKICHNFKKEIQNAHRFCGPSYKNTDANQWCINPWEVAKCFMPPDGYKDVTNAKDTDFNGINSVIINFKAFQSKVKDDLSKKFNIFEQGREVGRGVRHSPQLEMEDTDLQQYFSVLQNLLSDSAYLSANTDAQNAKTKLLQLQNDTLIIGKDDIRNLLDDVAKAVQEKIRTEVDEQKKVAENTKLELISITNESVKAIESQGILSIAQLDKALESAINDLEKQTKASLKKVQSEAEIAKKQIGECADKGVSKLNVEAEAGVKQIKESADKGINKLADEAEVGVKQIKESADQGVNKLEVEIEAGGKQIKESADKVVNKLEVEAEAGVKQIKESADKGVNKLGDEAEARVKQIEKSTDKGVNKLKVKAEAEVSKISAKADEKLKQIEESTRGNKEDEYNKVKEELKDDLAAFYKTRYSTIPLSPLVEGHDTPLVDFYILPEMNLIEKKDKKPAWEETKTPVKSLAEVFQSENSCEIYLTADAGFGKTAFSKYLAITWCQAHRPEMKYKKYFSEDTITAMRGFEFLLFVLLRDSSDDCSIDDLIINQIIQNLSRFPDMTKDYLRGILHREKTLIILDGLDEWTHPEKKCRKVPKTIPHRNAREKCVILTTTRPWKLGVLNLKTSEIDKKVELVKLTSESAQTLEERAISKIKNLDVTEAEILAEQLHETIYENDLEDLESVPLLSMYLISLWCEDIPLGQSKCGLYASIIELLMSRTLSKHPEMEPTCEISKSDIPQCFSEHKHCYQYCTYLKTLGTLAFETLLSETKEKTLVFNKSVADNYLSPNDLKLGLDSGILTQSTEKTLIKQISKVFFSHKTIQEFFCALYISCQNENDVKNIILNKCKSLQSILDMSTVLAFISGMNAKIISSISQEFLSVISEDKRTSEYRSTTTERDCEPLKDIQDMYISCMKENTSDKELKLFCQDFFFTYNCKDEKYFSYLTRLAVQNKNNLESINIDTEDSGVSLLEIIKFCALHELFQINKIYYWGDDDQDQLPVLLNMSSKCVSVSSSGSWSRKMLETLQNNSLLQTIYIFNFAMSHDVLNVFLNYIINRKTMTEIRLWFLSCTEHGESCTFSLDFSQHSGLRKLELVAIPEVSQLKVNSQVKHVELLGSISLGEMSLPPEMANIELVDLWMVSMSASTLRDLVKVVEKLSHKVTVTINKCKIEPETEFEHIKQYICSSQNFRVTENFYSWKFVFETKVESYVTK